jgi:putative ABC transport system permease protein
VLLSALSGLADNKLRAALTTLGVVIGVTSVVAMLALGNGARAAVEASFRFLGANDIQIAPKLRLDRGTYVPAGKTLSYQDGLDLPAAASLVTGVDMQVNGPGKVRHGRATLDMGVTGTTAHAIQSMIAQGQVQPVGWNEGRPLSERAFLAQGRFFTPGEVAADAAVCVLGYQTALDLFQGDDPIGEAVFVNRQRCLVIGTLVELVPVDLAERQRLRPNEAFFLPISTAVHSLYETEPSVYMTARVADAGRILEAEAQVATFLRQRHGVEKDAEGSYADDFTLTTRAEVLGAQQEAAGAFALLLAGMAAVSLLVGGIGIMNVMLVSVTERTREIGVRLAVGARPRDIVAQFLAEAVALSTCGGILGVAVGILAIPATAGINRSLAVLDPASVPLALGVALLVGVVFGLYPAVRASRLDPIEALRHE